VNPLRRRLLLLPLAAATDVVRAGVEYPDVQSGVPLAFPADEGAHPAFRNEWWYITGWARDDRGRDIGLQITFFRNRPGVAEAGPSQFTPRQLLFAHAALADPQVQRLRVDERAAREGFGLATALQGRTDVHLGDWSLTQQGNTYRARIPAREFLLDIAFAARDPVLLQGDNGVSRKGPDPRDASYYYSRPQLAISGSIMHDDRASPVTGTAWLDHEWSTRYLTADAAGWDWTGINFDDGGALMAFRIRNARGETLWAGGAYRDSRATRRVFAPEEVTFTPQRRWRSPRTGIDYPVSFRVRAGDLDAVLDPLFPDQELDARRGVGVVYWEGAVRALIGDRVVGRGYLELTGYGEALRI
jgi:predicted secreted hydrolase